MNDELLLPATLASEDAAASGKKIRTYHEDLAVQQEVMEKKKEPLVVQTPPPSIKPVVAPVIPVVTPSKISFTPPVPEQAPVKNEMPAVFGNKPLVKAPSPKQQSWGAVISIVIIVLMVVIGALYAWGKRIAEQQEYAPLQQTQ